MGVFEFYDKALGINPIVGKWVTGGLIILAGVAIVGLFGMDFRTAAVGSICLVILSVVAILISRMSPDSLKLPGQVLVLFIVLAFVAFCTTVFSAWAFDTPKPAACLFGTEEACDRATTRLERQRDGVELPEVATQGLTNAAGSNPRPPAPTDKFALRKSVIVYVQFAALNRDNEVTPVATRLKEIGWAMQGYLRGGQRVAAAAGKSEIRYHFDDQIAAAQLLAEEARANGWGSQALRLVKSSEVTPGSLEVWISK